MDTRSLKQTSSEYWNKFRALPVVDRILKPGPKVAVLRLSGIIADQTMRRGGISHARHSKLIEKAFGLSRIEAVALIINSPGGAPGQCSLIAGHIRALADEKKLPVYAFVEDVAASGGYWLACAGDEIYAQESSIIGSVGVISTGFGLDGFIRKHDITRRIYTSGKDKSFLDPFLPEKDSDVARLKTVQNEIHENFKSWVTERRGEKLEGSDSKLFEGEFWSGAGALKLGLIDGFGEMRAVMRDKLGKKVRFAELHPEKKLIPSILKGELDSSATVRAILEVIDERSIWSRYGL